MKKAVFVYEPGQVSLVSQLITHPERGEYEVIAVGADIEFLLEKRGIAFKSARGMRTMHASDRMISAEDLGRTIFSSSELSFFQYRGVRYGELFTLALQYYIALFTYYLDIAVSALEEPYDEVIVYKSSAVAPPTAGVIHDQVANALPDAVQLVCSERHIRLTLCELPERKARALFFFVKRTIFGIAINALNFLVRILVPRKKIRMLASEQWRNIQPLMREFPKSELLLLDRTESLKAGLHAIVRNRMQFIHSDAYISRTMQATAREKSRMFVDRWNKTRAGISLLSDATFRGYKLQTILEAVITHMMSWSEKAVRDTDATWAMIEHLRPDIVVVRATASLQTHFTILCEVARAQGIPSLEIQHGLLSVGPESFTRPHAAENIAEYGPLVRRQWEDNNYAPHSKLFDVGSPRFDEYHSIPAPAAPGDKFRIVLISTLVSSGFWTDSYDVFDYYVSTAEAVRHIPNVSVTIKLRPDIGERGFYEEAIARTFRDIPYRISQNESLVDVLAESDAVISCHSAALIEAMISFRPVILDASLPIFASLARFDLEPHRLAGALLVTHTKQELTDTLARLARDSDARGKISGRAEQFMRENYLFYDGKGSRRLADLIIALVEERRAARG